MSERTPSEPVRLEVQDLNDMIDNQSSGDPFQLNRFLEAQSMSYADAIAELRAGRKQSHWMWYVLPQISGLGRSSMAVRYSIPSLDEARGYLSHAVLGSRLIQCCEAVLAIEGRSAFEIMGSPDDLKLKSCATLFGSVSPKGSVFHRILDKYYGGEPDEATLELIARQ